MILRSLCFLAGIVYVQQLSTLPESQMLWILVGIMGVLIYFHRWSLAFFAGGLVWAITQANIRLEERLPESLAGRDIELTGTIADLPKHENNRVRFNFKSRSSDKSLPKLIRLTWYYPDTILKAGQHWQLTVRLKPPHGNFNPGGFDYEGWLFTEGIGATGYIRTSPKPQRLDTKPSLLNPEVWRQAVADRIDDTRLAADSKAIIKALTVGDGDSLSPHQWEIFRLTGTTHLMVISGSHIALIAGTVYAIVLRLWAWTGILRYGPQTLAAMAAIISSFLYAALTGFSVPAQRAVIMIAVAMLAIACQRNTHPFSVLAVALFAVLLFDPLAVLSPGFWLSFIAVSLIVYVTMGRIGQIGLVTATLKVNLLAAVGLSPLLLYFFQQVSLISPLANMIAAPVVGLLLVPSALLTLPVLFLTPLAGEKLLNVVDIPWQLLWKMLLGLGALPIATLNHNQPVIWALILALPGMLVLFAPKGIPARWLGLLMFLPLIFSHTPPLQPGQVKLTLLDVGQGLATVVQTATHVLIFDTGAQYSATSDSGENVVLPYLRKQGIRHIDLLTISHGDNDHIGGAESVLAGIDTDLILTSVPEKLTAHSPLPCRAGQHWQWDDVNFAVLWPTADNRLSGNNHSCVIKIESQFGSALLTGDIEEETETLLVEGFNNRLKSNVMIAPHHGSHTSSTQRFLSAVSPKIVLIPAGYRNPFGHPHEEVLSRYRRNGIRWFDSVYDGAIEILSGPDLQVKTWRKAAGKYWNFRRQ